MTNERDISYIICHSLFIIESDLDISKISCTFIGYLITQNNLKEL
jgi:hypothetical protein